MAISITFPPSLLVLEFSLPHTVQIAILIHSNGFVCAGAEYSFGLAIVSEVDAHTAVFCLYIDEGNVVILGHGMGHCAYLYLDVTIVYASHYGEVLLYTRINGVYSELLHLFAAAYDGNFRVYYLLDYITTMFALEKFYCHNI